MSKSLNPAELHQLKTHKLAARFPMMDDESFMALREDIKACGKVREPVYVYRGELLDGRNRVKAAIDLGNTRVEAIDVGDIDEAEALALVMSLNLHRRHLTAEQKRSIVAELLKATPAASDRKIAALAKVSDKTAAKVRRALEGTAEIPQLSKTTGRDGKSRAKPAPKLMPDPMGKPKATPRNTFTTNDGVEVVIPAGTDRAMVKRQADPSPTQPMEKWQPAPTVQVDVPASSVPESLFAQELRVTRELNAALAKQRAMDKRTRQSIRVHSANPLGSARDLLLAWQPRAAVQFYSELGYAMHQRGMISNWPEATAARLKDCGWVCTPPQAQPE